MRYATYASMVLAAATFVFGCKTRPEDSSSLREAGTGAPREPGQVVGYRCPAGNVRPVYVAASGVAAIKSERGSMVAPRVAPKTKTWSDEGNLVVLFGEGADADVAARIVSAGGVVHAFDPQELASVRTRVATGAGEQCGKAVDEGIVIGRDNAARELGWTDLGHESLSSVGVIEDMLQNLEGQAAAFRFDGDQVRANALVQEAESLRRANGTKRAFRFVHYNIKELTTKKLVDKVPQLAAAARTIRGLNPDILSINESQYDLPDVPTAGLPGTGKNMERLLDIIKLDGQWLTNLSPANTGKRAKKKPDGDYLVDPNGPGAAALIDPVSFGIFPGQYSTGFATRLSSPSRIVITSTMWRDWDPEFAFGGYTLPNGEPLPEDMELFDKNFNDVIVRMGERDVHVITFHTVPSFGFGGSAAMNIQRNAAQLRFLEWYLLGRCEPQSTSRVKRCATEVTPLAEGTPFIAVGDFNVDLTSTSDGAGVIKRMLEDPRVNNWRARNLDPAFRQDADGGYVSFLSDGVDVGKLQSELDYFIVSKEIEIDYGRVFAPMSEFKEHGCFPTRPPAEQKKAQVVVDAAKKDLSVSTRYQDDGTKKFCVVEVGKAWTAFRQGSDHFPLYVTLRWRDAN